jgi:hypothetical protein
MPADASGWYHADPAFLLVPGSLLVVTVLAFLLLADGLRRRWKRMSDQGRRTNEAAGRPFSSSGSISCGSPPTGR